MKNEPAFPTKVVIEGNLEGAVLQFEGLTKRELFSLLALHAVVTDGHDRGTTQEYVSEAVGIADALLKALEEGK
jgi:hypothetical protein